MIDGVGSVELTGSVMRPTPDPDPSLEEAPPRWIPRPVPSPTELFLAELGRRAAAPFVAAGAAARALTEPRAGLSAARDTVTGLGRAVGAGFSPASPTPFNVEIGPHRRFDWTVADLESLKATRTRYGGTVNDVVLAVLAGALGRFFYRRGVETAHMDFRVMVPVNARDAATRLDARQPGGDDGRQAAARGARPGAAARDDDRRDAAGEGVAAGARHAGAGGAERLDVHLGDRPRSRSSRRCHGRTTWW